MSDQPATATSQPSADSLERAADRLATMRTEILALAADVSGVPAAQLQVIADQLDRGRSVFILTGRAGRRGPLPRRTPGATLVRAQQLDARGTAPDLARVTATGELVRP